MTNSNDRIKKFSGQVKVSDIQAAFTKIVNRINTLIDNYNSSVEVQDIDYSKGNAALAPGGYALSIGGLKRVMEAYDGFLIGGRVFKIDNGNAIITPGIYITSNQIYRIQSQTIPVSSNTLYLNTDSGNISTSTQGMSTIETAFTQPTFTGNSTWGNVYSSFDSSNAFRALDNNESTSCGAIRQQSGVISSMDWTWNFKENLKLSSINIKIPYEVVVQLFYFGSNYLKVTDLSGNILYEHDYGDQLVTEVTIPVSTNYISGIRITVGNNRNANSMIGIKEVKLTGIVRETVVEQVPGNYVVISELDSTRDNIPMNNHSGVQSEDNNTYKLRSQDRGINLGQEYVPSDTINFVNVDNYEIDGSSSSRTNATLFGEQVLWSTDVNRGGYVRAHVCVSPVNLLFLPKGVGNPFSYTGSKILVNNYSAWIEKK